MLKLAKDKVVSEINVAAYLLTQGFKQARPPGIREGQVVFFFEDPEGQLSKEINKYFNRDTRVDALTLVESIRIAKSQMTMLKRNTGGEQDE